jgi:site-specific recombinase XerD
MRVSELFGVEMLRHACGFALADHGADTRLIRTTLGTPEHPAHRQVHRNEPGAI